MALRGLGRRLLSPLLLQARPSPAGAAGWARASSTTPTVFDKMIQVFVIDKSGVRHTVRGIEGQDLASTLHEYGQFKDEDFMPHVFDPGYPDCHVYVQGDYLDKLPELNAEQQQDQRRLVGECARSKARDNSRMGHYIRLTPQLNGMTVALGDIEPWELQ